MYLMDFVNKKAMDDIQFGQFPQELLAGFGDGGFWVHEQNSIFPT